MTTNDFIKKAMVIHGDHYDYSLAEYSHSKCKVKIICTVHGVFEQEPRQHLQGQGCRHCGIKQRSKTHVLSTQEFIKRSNASHGDYYDYSLVEYGHSKCKVKIICPVHGVFEQKAVDHIRGKGCYLCGVEARKHSRNSFIEKATIVHQDKYDYSLVRYVGIRTKVTILCPKHGSFTQRPDSHLFGSGCPKCCSSLGEMKIYKYLINNGLFFEQEYRLDECKDKYTLPFDFVVFTDRSKSTIKCFIEYDGKQHVKSIEHFGGETGFIMRKKHDEIKNYFCEQKSLTLIRISHKDDIEAILQAYFMKED